MFKGMNKKRVATISVMVFVMLMMTVCVCFADTDVADVSESISKAIYKIIDAVKNIVNPIATLALIGCGIYYIWGSDSQNIQKAKKWAIAIIIGLIVINLSSVIVGWVSTIGA